MTEKWPEYVGKISDQHKQENEAVCRRLLTSEVKVQSHGSLRRMRDG
jgi:hypothetical protein